MTRAARQRAGYEDPARAEAYDALVSAEDCDANLGPALARSVGPGDLVVEIGAGTGRVTRRLLELGARVLATERAAPMLEVGARRVSGDVRWARADGRRLPVKSEVADAVVAGWVFGHLRLWMPDGWRDEVDSALEEARRVLGPGGRLVVIETLGTGVEAPGPPSEALAEYFAHLEGRHAMTRQTISTDYAFGDAEAAAACLGGFFGEAMAAKIRAKGWARVPEFSGVWTRTR